MNNSKELWHSLYKDHPTETIEMGEYASATYKLDPKHICYTISRYKFCSRMFNGLDTVIEIGIGDGFCTPIIANVVNHMICLDIDKTMLEKTRKRNAFLQNVAFEYFDIGESPYHFEVDGICMIDMIEHLYPEEEAGFMKNVVKSLKSNGVTLIGTPNEAADQYASEGSRRAHVNLKNHKTLLQLGFSYFNNVFLFGMNDEVLHTGFPQMCHFLWILCVGPKKSEE